VQVCGGVGGLAGRGEPKPRGEEVEGGRLRTLSAELQMGIFPLASLERHLAAGAVV
jgi:hypothetical protein